MGDEAREPAARYAAFISYNHADAAFGRWLHASLERFVVPRRMVGRPGAHGPVPRRLAPIFRDREELSAAADLGIEVREALARSAALVVVCSPAAAASRWVSREVELFRSLHPDRRVLAALAAGEPAESFPAGLVEIGQGGVRYEPLAADFRSKADGRRLALLKLAAGLLGVRLDELAQRDAQRRIRRVTAVTVAALLLSLGMGFTALFALNARRDAVTQRGEAEGLVEFMLTDMRDRLKGVGRLDIMTAANRRALRYYARQDLRRLPPDSLERRARVLHAMGEDDQARGDYAAAGREFDEAARTTSALLKTGPDDPERIFTHAQSQFWLGSIQFSQNRFWSAEKPLLEYKRLADRLIKSDAQSARYRMEAVYAEGTLCTLHLKLAGRLDAAVNECEQSLRQARLANALKPRSPETMSALASRLAWYADLCEKRSSLMCATRSRLEEQALVRTLMAADSRNADYLDTWIANQRALSRLARKSGDISTAQRRISVAIDANSRLVALDPANTRWVMRARELAIEERNLESTAGVK